MSFTVLITDAVDPVCIAMLEEKGIKADVQLKKTPEELKQLAPQADGWIIRSGTQISEELLEAASNLKVVGRAGVGVDNVDLEAATRKGVLVINAPDGNTISTAEHTCAMLLALARHIPQANASLMGGQWERKSFSGSELKDKVLGIVGVGKIGRSVASRMQSFDMEVVGFDPVLSPEVAERMGIRLVSIEELFSVSDFITVHTPLNDATRSLFNDVTLAKCKQGVRIVNCARGGIIDEHALLRGLNSGQVGGAALDVYSQEPPPEGLDDLLKHPNLVATPHIAASTSEAQKKVALQITEQVIKALHGDPVSSPVNAMAIRMASQKEVQPYLKLAERLGSVVSQLVDGQMKRVKVRCHGDVPHRYAEVITISALRGILSFYSNEPVNLINAPVLAESMGLKVEEHRGMTSVLFTNQVEIELQSTTQTHRVSGIIFDDEDTRLVGVDEYDVEVRLEGRLLFYKNEDRPGMVAAVGGILADADINIGTLQLGRTGGRGSMALTALSVDEDIPDSVLVQISSLEGVSGVRLVQI